jgi:hypothetical protein
VDQPFGSGVDPVSPSRRADPEPLARQAAVLLADVGLHSNKYSIDAMLSAAALAAPGPVTIPTSDPEDQTALCAGRPP